MLKMERHVFGTTPYCEQARGTVVMSSGEYRKEHDELIRLREAAPNADTLSESIWRSVLAQVKAEGFELHEGCELDDPQDCGLYFVIAMEVESAIRGKR